jgi:hypothetical protein
MEQDNMTAKGILVERCSGSRKGGSEVDRRKFVKTAAAGAISAASAQKYSVPIIDTHVHLYDPTRPALA